MEDIEDTFDYKAAWYAFMQCVSLARRYDLDLIVSPIGSFGPLYVAFVDAGDVTIASSKGKDPQKVLEVAAQQLHLIMQRD